MFIMSNDMVMAKFPRGQTYLLNVCLLMTIPFRQNFIRPSQSWHPSSRHNENKESRPRKEALILGLSLASFFCLSSAELTTHGKKL